MPLEAATKKRIMSAEPSGTYSVHPGVYMAQKWVEMLKVKTGWRQQVCYMQVT
ncbi:MAG: hypothetical protein SGJ05_06755 [bacterium]|nr:hypothetical protein [bacterium]